MAAMGSLAERQEFLRSAAKPPCRFQGQAPAPLMTGDGWKGEWQLTHAKSIGPEL